MPRIASSIALAAVLALASTGLGAREWLITDAVIRIALSEQRLDDLQLSVAGATARTGDGLYRLEAEGRVRFFDEAVGFQHLLDGELRIGGDLHIGTPDGMLDLGDTRLAAVPGSHDFRIIDATGAELFRLSQSHTWLDPATGELSFGDMDVTIGKALAARLGQPRYVGMAIAGAHLEMATNLPRRPALKGGEICGVEGPGQTCTYTPPGGGNVIDVALTSLSGFSLSVLSPARVGDQVSAAPNARLENVGSADVIWCQAIAPDSPVGPHPFLVMNVYRIDGNELEQIGRSGVKHAFFAVNDSCSCQGDQILYAGCGDVYGVFSNTDNKYLAPRTGINPVTGDWTSLGSHFDGTPVDDIRDHAAGDHGGGFGHRLVLSDSDLSTPGADYFMEGWYLVADDVNPDNNIGHRLMVPDQSTGEWTFSIPAGELTRPGPALDSWVNPDAPGPGAYHERITTAQGRLRLAVRTSALGGGQYRYDYALMNLDHTIGLESFAIGLPASVLISDTDFDDGDPGQADWSVQQPAGRIEWTAPGGAEALAWGVLYRFAFTADDEPFASADAELVPTGGGPALQAVTLVPGVGIFDDSFEL